MPTFDASNGDYSKIATLAKDIAALAEGHCTTDPYLADPNQSAYGPPPQTARAARSIAATDAA